MNLALLRDEDVAACHCSECGIRYYVPKQWQQNRREDHNTFYCPNGHNQFYSHKSEAEKLREQLAAEKQRLNLALQRENEERARANKLATVADKLTKAAARHKKRAANGVCPCCTRTFKQLALHMKNKHPEYVDGQ